MFHNGRDLFIGQYAVFFLLLVLLFNIHAVATFGELVVFFLTAAFV